MNLLIVPSDLKIRSKVDIDLFLNCIKNSKTDFYYSPVGDYDMCIYYDSKRDEFTIGERHKSARGNIFNPYITLYEKNVSNTNLTKKYVWKHRKYINNSL